MKEPGVPEEAAMAHPKSKRSPSDRRSGGFRALAATLDKLTRPIFGKRGLADGAIVTAWPLIVGESLAKVTLPERISYPRGDRRDGTLYLRVAGGSFATELIHLEPQLIERINRYFGYRAVARVRLNQGPVSRQAAATGAGTAAPSDMAAAETAPAAEPDARLAAVSDPDLLEALKSLGHAIENRQSGATKRS